MNNAPEASQLVLLSQLSGLATGNKVRFLGCVDIYETKTATLLLKDRFSGSPTDATSVTVNVSNIVDALNVEMIQVGAWINVIGYVRTLESPCQDRRSNGSNIRHQTAVIGVDAVMVWSAEAVKLDAYEAAIRDLQATSDL